MSTFLPAGRARAGAVVAALLALALATGCASYTSKALSVRQPLERGDWEAAETFLVEEKPGGDGLPYLMELGLVQHYAGRYDDSNLTFQRAEDLVQELWTKSVSRELLAFATSDETTDYDGEMWERVLINYYRAMNYISLGEFEGALVECRKMNQKLRVYAAAEDDPPTYDSDAFAQWVTAMLYEAGGDISDSWVSLRLADEGYRRWGEAYGASYPPSLQEDLVRLAEYQGFRDDAERLRERFDLGVPAGAAGGSAEGWSAPPPGGGGGKPAAGSAEVVLFWEEGFIPAKIQREITIPILKNEWGDNWVALAPVLVDRFYAPITYKRWELQYLLRVALPDYAPLTPGEGPGRATLALRAPDGEPDLVAHTEIASDLNAIARHGLADAYGKILLRTVARGLSKYALTRAAESESQIAGLITNIFTAASEKADTRAWITLPRSIQVARLALPPGRHDLELTTYGPQGGVRETVTFEGVEVGEDEVYFLSHRTF